MRFAVDGWNPEYGVALDATFDPTSEPVDAAVECPLAEWAPIGAPAAMSTSVLPATVLFIDGVRRIDASVWISADDDPSVSRQGVCATVAAGAVLSTRGGHAEVLCCRVLRGVFAAAGVEVISTRHGDYAAVPVVDDSPEGIYLAVHTKMTALEAEVSAAVLAGDVVPELVVFDGPLRGRTRGVGYVKTQHVQYLPDEQHRVVGALAAGERTPMFLIGGRWSRWSWYLRLPGAVAHPLSGVVRCELPHDTSGGVIAELSEKADAITAVLGRFASEPHKDARAPQNLYPIAGLERELRRRLGDPRLLELALRRAAAG